ncbi:RNA degradosome polyphosphate kinase [Lachnobacterium bovis]|jgi:polyphosphate kinase|uniref:Polyphosphate kinase n=1 Tax=Lachnobacterium bovis DSM 14045 TaxID=1122142 RepID=A0A1H3FUG7_9FIRM|nr:RNA degradosome polyphosphate kinase [Lachnobacterium bovis]MBQ1801580.1 RNA degradosome polyphosphate kinase [Lachnobacterium sp.]SDX93779.1 polyphosphate kinase [Lachnobacterium bovis DSM 14045]
MEKIDFENSKYYENRELSWIKFDRRVLDEARDKNIPLLERLKFLSITSSNLDEFYMVRVASLKDMVNADYRKKDIAGMNATEQLAAINEATRELTKCQYSTFTNSLVPLLKQNKINLINEYEKLSAEQIEFVDNYFMDNVYPVLTPMAVDASRPFPLIRNKTLNIAALLKSNKEKENTMFATVQVPGGLNRLVTIPNEDGDEKTFILLEQIIERNLDKLFSNYEILCAYPYRVMRNADFTIDEDEASDLLLEIQNKLKLRQWGEAIRLEVENKIDDRLLGILRRELKLDNEEIFKIPGPIDLTVLSKLFDLKGYDNLRYEKYIPQQVPQINQDKNIFANIRDGDILIHHPYQSFQPVVDFIRQAAADPKVLAIKQTLYRVSGNSPIIRYLAQAAENGKQVTVLVELKARFDEEHNIVWAKKLERSGCHVIYGLVGLKTHSKIALVVRREEEGIRRYVHLGTGNYNDSTAKVYTDCGIFTCKESIGEDATAVFNMLSGYSEPLSWNELVLAPYWLRDKFLYLIKREINNVKNGLEGRIIAKMNSLCDKEIIKTLYMASAAGVKIDLVVRGICCLKVGIPGVSENITVRSIVGNFLEHSRIFYFFNGGEEDIFLGSADWMPRNLDRRVEIVFPVIDSKLKERVKHILDIELEDNVKARVLTFEGQYLKINRRGKKPINSQMIFCKEAKELVKKDSLSVGRVFIPTE